jgi:hypothetical protein
MKIFPFALLLVLAALTAAAADVTGAWSGSFKITLPDGQTRDDTVYFALKQNGTTITGTAGPNAGQQVPIAKGSISGNRVTLEVPVPDGMFQFDVVLDGEHLRGEVTRTAGGQSMKARVDSIRVR